MNELIMPHNVGVKNVLENMKIQECDRLLSPVA